MRYAQRSIQRRSHVHVGPTKPRTSQLCPPLHLCHLIPRHFHQNRQARRRRLHHHPRRLLLILRHLHHLPRRPRRPLHRRAHRRRPLRPRRRRPLHRRPLRRPLHRLLRRRRHSSLPRALRTSPRRLWTASQSRFPRRGPSRCCPRLPRRKRWTSTSRSPGLRRPWRAPSSPPPRRRRARRPQPWRARHSRGRAAAPSPPRG
mmetsp:Transcript_40556/g.131278  ORF Transcript_40556/g.131278 Transcript_40556/m.131278 type:complete len:202 (+) Transcript_40556:177-782(+)